MKMPDPQRVEAIIRETAKRVILPRFCNLDPGDVRAKTAPHDLVTVADIESERLLTAELTALLPGSLAVGEEAAETDVSVLRRLAGDAPVWLLDPVDGTRNFAKGNQRFAVIVAFCVGGEAVMSWTHAPVGGQMAFAAVGEGAWIDGQRVSVPTHVPLEKMVGSLGFRHIRHVEKLRRRGTVKGLPAGMVRGGCTGLDYVDLAAGRLHFAQYGGRLKPWDHAAGLLLQREAGGYSALVGSGRAYRPAKGIFEDQILAAPDKDTWNALLPLLDD